MGSAYAIALSNEISQNSLIATTQRYVAPQTYSHNTVAHTHNQQQHDDGVTPIIKQYLQKHTVVDDDDGRGATTLL